MNARGHPMSAALEEGETAARNHRRSARHAAILNNRPTACAAGRFIERTERGHRADVNASATDSMKKKWIGRLALVLALSLLLPAIGVSAEAFWAGKYRDYLYKTYNPRTMDYYGLVDIGLDGVPELAMGRIKGNKYTIELYYVAQNGRVTRTSKTIPVGYKYPVGEDIKGFELVRTSGRYLWLAFASCKSPNGKTTTTKQFVLGQNARGAFTVTERFRVVCRLSDERYTYYVNGKKTSESKFYRENDAFYDSILSYHRSVTCDAYYASTSALISQYNRDVLNYSTYE